MKLAIVGHAKDKFTDPSEYLAKAMISYIIKQETPSLVISGGSPLGGVDIWTEQLAKRLNIPTCIYQPEVHQWNPAKGYGFKARNLDIANNCDVLYNVVVRDWPLNYKGKKYQDYHCAGKNMPVHVKSGGCWTAWKAVKLNKRVHWAIVDGEIVRATTASTQKKSTGKEEQWNLRHKWN